MVSSSRYDAESEIESPQLLSRNKVKQQMVFVCRVLNGLITRDMLEISIHDAFLDTIDEKLTSSSESLLIDIDRHRVVMLKHRGKYSMINITEKVADTSS